MDLASLRTVAREVFACALSSVDASEAIRRSVRVEGLRLTVLDTSIDLAARRSNLYVIAAGKAAPAMAAALAKILGNHLTAGVISGPAYPADKNQHRRFLTSHRWQFFAGGHPLPNQDSLKAAQASFELLKRADEERAIVLFLVSGGGSAMIEWPIDPHISLEDLSNANRRLVSCGASIAEVNAVRRALSAVKGGRLAAQAPNATQISLIVSDTNPDDQASVASGPSIIPNADAPDARAVVDQYQALANLPPSILSAINNSGPDSSSQLHAGPSHRHHVLLDNRTALEAAAAAARRYGLLTEIALDVIEPRIEAGCSLLLSKLDSLRSQAVGKQNAVCIISGGEFLCPVKGQGTGGRNAETVLRCAIEIDQRSRHPRATAPIVVLSAGTDGIDGNSPAAGAIADNGTLERARSLGLDARAFLESSDAFNFFDRLGDAIVTGATGTNVRDVRIVLAR